MTFAFFCTSSIDGSAENIEKPHSLESIIETLMPFYLKPVSPGLMSYPTVRPGRPTTVYVDLGVILMVLLPTLCLLSERYGTI